MFIPLFSLSFAGCCLRLAAVGIGDRTGADDGTSERAADLPPGVTDHGRANRDGELTTTGEHYNVEGSFDVYLLLTPFNCYIVRFDSNERLALLACSVQYHCSHSLKSSGWKSRMEFSME
jgi:hypothetical protein